MTLPFELSGEFKRLAESLPFPIYCTELLTGKFRFVNTALASFLGYKKNDLVGGGTSAKSLYTDEGQRNVWVQEMRKRPGEVVTFFANFNCNVVMAGRTTTRRLFGVDISRTYEKEGEKPLVLGLLADATDNGVEREIDARRIEAYREILDLEWINAGVHQVDHDGNLIWMNKREQQLLGIHDLWSEELRHVCELSPRDDQDDARRRVHGKIMGSHPLTVGEHRTFVDFRPEEQTAEDVVPVNILDIGILESGERKHSGEYRELFTTVRDERIPEDLAEILREFGPRNPLLEDLDIRTFIKVYRRIAPTLNMNMPSTPGQGSQGSEDLVFVYGNRPFFEELKSLADARRLEVVMKDERDFLGKMEWELFPSHSASFTAVDFHAIGREREDQRIEKHPLPRPKGETDVHVLKIPLEVEGESRPVGIQGFYWEVGGDKTAVIRRKLKESYRPWEILDDIPAPIYRIDRHRRYTYGNQVYIEEIRKSHPEVERMWDIVGKTSEDVHQPDVAKRFREDDEKVLSGQEKSVDRFDILGRRPIRIIKTPIRRQDADPGSSRTGDREIVGVQAIFWDVKESIEPQDPESEIWIDWKRHFLHVPGEAPKKITHHKDDRKWLLFDILRAKLGQVVSYAEIAKDAFRDERMAGDIRGGSRKAKKKATDNINNTKRHLAETLKAFHFETIEFHITSSTTIQGYVLEAPPKDSSG